MKKIVAFNYYFNWMETSQKAFLSGFIFSESKLLPETRNLHFLTYFLEISATVLNAKSQIQKIYNFN